MELLELCLCVSAVPEPNTNQGTIQTDKIMDEKGVENLSCILVAFLIAIALAALDRKAYPSQRAGKSSPAPTVTLKPVANIQRWGPSQWGVERWLRDPGQPCHSQNGAQLWLLPVEDPYLNIPVGFLPTETTAHPGLKLISRSTVQLFSVCFAEVSRLGLLLTLLTVPVDSLFCIVEKVVLLLACLFCCLGNIH